MESTTPTTVDKQRPRFSLRLRSAGKWKTLSNPYNQRLITANESDTEGINKEANKPNSFSTEALVSSLPHVSSPELSQSSQQEELYHRPRILITDEDDSESDTNLSSKIRSKPRCQREKCKEQARMCVKVRGNSSAASPAAQPEATQIAGKAHQSTATQTQTLLENVKKMARKAEGSDRCRRENTENCVAHNQTANKAPTSTDVDPSNEKSYNFSNEESHNSSVEDSDNSLDKKSHNSSKMPEIINGRAIMGGKKQKQRFGRPRILSMSEDDSEPDTPAAQTGTTQINAQAHQSAASPTRTHLENAREMTRTAGGSVRYRKENTENRVAVIQTANRAGSSTNVDIPDNEDYNSPEMCEKINDCAIMDGKFFKVCAAIVDTEHVPVRCQLCVDKKQLIGSFSVSTNLVKHLKRFHNADHEKYLEYKKSKADEKRKRKSLTNSENEPPTKRRRTFRQFGVDPKNFEDRVLRFVIESMSPLSITDHPSFRALFTGMNVQPVSRKKLTNRLAVVDDMRREVTTELLSKTEFVCSTADIWSAKRRSFIGVTCHFIDEDYKRQSLPLACKRFKGTHSYDKIAEILHDVHSVYGLNEQKIVATITDNARNFVKAFQEFGINLNASMLELAETEELESDQDDDASSDIETIAVLPTLPQHLRCSSHTLNLVATTDLFKAIRDDERLHRRHTKSIAKCTKIWHKAALPKSAEIITDTVGHTFSYPIVTRWNSLYDSLKQILEEVGALPLLFERLGLGDSFTDSEISYMDEYCQIMSPLAQAIDILQGEEKVFYGVLLPTLITLKRRLQRLTEGKFKYGKPLAEACLKGITKRFENIISSESDERSLLATISHPGFKLKWLEKANATYNLKINLRKARDMFLKEGELYQVQATLSCSQHSNDSLSSFFKVDASQRSDIDSESNGNSQVPGNNAVHVQLLTFLNDPRTHFSMLDDYPIAKKLFFKYNTPIPSSAPVERLFSFASIANTPKRHALTDKNFERIVLLKAFSKTGRELT